jgi:hypothetical protein
MCVGRLGISNASLCISEHSQFSFNIAVIEHILKM